MERTPEPLSVMNRSKENVDSVSTNSQAQAGVQRTGTSRSPPRYGSACIAITETSNARRNRNFPPFPESQLPPSWEYLEEAEAIADDCDGECGNGKIGHDLKVHISAEASNIIMSIKDLHDKKLARIQKAQYVSERRLEQLEFDVAKCMGMGKFTYAWTKSADQAGVHKLPRLF